MKLINNFLNFGFAAVLTLSAASCGDDTFVPDPDDPFAQPGDRAETFEVPINLIADKPLNIGNPFVNDIVSRADGDDETPGDGSETADPEKAAEEAIHDIWVFQFDKNGNQLIAPRYYEVSSVIIKELNIRLAEGEDSRVYVLANTGDPDWAVGKDLTTEEKFVGYQYPFTEENVEMGNDEYLLMEGHVNETIRRETDLLPVDIHLTRMMAKISFSYVTAEAAKDLVVTRVLIHNMPEMMRMEETPIEENYPGPNGEDFETRSVTLDRQLASGSVYTFYMPANRRGVKKENTDPKLKNNGAPEKALYVQLFISSKSNGSSFLYTIYLGANDYNDYNVRRNHNYNITLNLNSEKRDDRVLAAPANCFVLDQQDEIMFDPYTRTETAGGWKYSDYVNKRDPKKKIVRADIVWQQPNVIGDNTPVARATQGDKVYLDEYDRIHVKSAKTNGNALIAGYNEDGEIVWSWHIWVNNGKPAELAAAVPYYTFAWDSNGIKTAQGRVRKGRSLMKCNLGAIDPNRNESRPDLTFGCIYQWGRKDPFPSSWNVNRAGSSWLGEGANSYNSTLCGAIHNNANKAITFDGTGKEDNAARLFRTKSTSNTTGTIEYTLKNPTHFISSLKSPTTAADNSGTLTDYVTGTDGDWYYGPGATPVHADNLWGGSAFATAMHFLVGGNASTVVSDNGATEKSIFDPCPAGWMVPPADMWLSFTIDGVNKNDNGNTSYPNMNTIDNQSTNIKARGYRMCMSQTYKDPSVTVFFPSQGVRLVNGNFNQIGYCGNYHTSTGGPGGRTNAFHMHTPNFMYPFETGYGYTRRATGCSIRCVRDVDE